MSRARDRGGAASSPASAGVPRPSAHRPPDPAWRAGPQTRDPRLESPRPSRRRPRRGPLRRPPGGRGACGGHGDHAGDHERGAPRHLLKVTHGAAGLRRRPAVGWGREPRDRTVRERLRRTSTSSSAGAVPVGGAARRDGALRIEVLRAEELLARAVELAPPGSPRYVAIGLASWCPTPAGSRRAARLRDRLAAAVPRSRSPTSTLTAASPTARSPARLVTSCAGHRSDAPARARQRARGARRSPARGSVARGDARGSAAAPAPRSAGPDRGRKLATVTDRGPRASSPSSPRSANRDYRRPGRCARSRAARAGAGRGRSWMTKATPPPATSVANATWVRCSTAYTSAAQQMKSRRTMFGRNARIAASGRGRSRFG